MQDAASTHMNTPPRDSMEQVPAQAMARSATEQTALGRQAQELADQRARLRAAALTVAAQEAAASEQRNGEPPWWHFWKRP
jgi:hypothetical protein